MTLKNNKLLIIVGSVDDGLTLKLVNSFRKNLILVLDCDNSILIDPLKNLNKSINKDFSYKDLSFYLKSSKRIIDFYKDCIFLFEFRKNFSKIYKNINFTLKLKKKLKRFFYNRRSLNISIL